MSETAKPLACPWCHAENISVEWEHCDRLDSTDTNRRWFAECGKCACQGPFCQTEPKVIPAWNTRFPDARLEQAEKSLAELRAIAEGLASRDADFDTIDGVVAAALKRRETLQAFTEWKERNP